MCGLVGLVDHRRASSADELLEAVTAMASALVRRGPDAEGSWCDPAAGVAFGFRRLAINDLSPAGHQPMMSADGRITVVCNGEVYGQRAVRAELEALGVRFRGRSDTEVLVEAIARWGIEAALTKVEGMFGLAAWDAERRVLHLARDRFGEKPLYVGSFGRQVLFASDLRSFGRVPGGVGLELDRDAIASYLRWGYIADPHAVYRHVEKVRPGCILTIEPGNPSPPCQRRYWDPAAEMTAVAGGFRGSIDDAVDAVLDQVTAAVGQRLDADVPLGAFLSGGVDSSIVVAITQQLVDHPVQTFTIGFREADHDESAHAAAVARHLGTEHRRLLVTPDEAREVIPLLPSIYDEPFADSSAIPTYLVSRLASDHVTVVLSGDGGDELFGGYDRYQWARRIWRGFERVPAGVRRALAAAVPSSAGWERLLDPLQHVGGPAAGLDAERVRRLADLLGEPGPEPVYRRLISHWKDPGRLVLGAQEVPTPYDDAGRWHEIASFEERMMLADTCTYLPGDILTKVDRATMAVSMEARVPLLDRGVARLAWSLPVSMRVGDGVGKPVLRGALHRLVPAALVDRPKMGFAVPLGAWLRGPLRSWADDLLDEDRLRAGGLLDPAPIRQLWNRHLAGERDAMYYLWDVLVLQAWIDAHPDVRV